jgi:hypothetical protein
MYDSVTMHCIQGAISFSPPRKTTRKSEIPQILNVFNHAKTVLGGALNISPPVPPNPVSSCHQQYLQKQQPHIIAMKMFPVCSA